MKMVPRTDVIRFRGGAGQDQTLSAKRIRSSPEVFEPARRQLGIAHGVLDIPVPEVSLQRPRVVALVALALRLLPLRS